jgi:streptomycin 6-kinase
LREAFLFVDAYDLGVIMREDPLELTRDGPHRRAPWLATARGATRRRSGNGASSSESTGLLATSIERQPVGRQMVQAAETIARQWANLD